MKPGTFQIMPVLIAIIIMILAGCGNEMSGNITAVSSKSSTECIACHATNDKSVSTVTGLKIVEEWQRSPHNTANGAACLDCHRNSHFHQDKLTCKACHANAHTNRGSLCSDCHGANSPNVGDCRSCHATPHKNIQDCNTCHNGITAMKDPDAAGSCLICHTAASMKTYKAHFVGGATYDATKAAYVTPYDTTPCRLCHNPHDTTTVITFNRLWALSGHGDVTKEPWMHYKWRGAARNACQRCHTAGGFRYFMTTGTLPTSAIFGQYTAGREALGCKGCHINYSWKRITPVVAFTTPYTPSLGASNTFPSASNIGDTQLCIPCHAGLSGGEKVASLTAAPTTDFGGYNSHYMAAAGLMFVKAGFANFTSTTAPAFISGTTATTYGATLKSTDDGGRVNSTHRILGTPAMATDSHVGGRGLISGGPCVTCHMKGGHSLGITSDTFNRVCVNCHPSEGTTVLTGANFRTVFIEEQKIPFDDAMALAKDRLKNIYGIEYDAANYPYFWPTGLASHTNRTLGFKDWTKGGSLTTAEAKRLLGACFNINILSREPAAYVHARTYTRRLLYDTIDWLDDRTINRSVGVTAAAYNPVIYTVTPDASTASESLKYLKGYNRTTNIWYAFERP